MRRGECLVQVDVHHIEAHIARTTGTQHGVEVSTIVVHQTTTVVNKLCNLRDAGLEKAKRVGIGHHHSGNGGAFYTD